jgi:20S proteasome alpha/beta subunit
MFNRQHPMVPRNTHSVFFPRSSNFLISNSALRQPIVTGTSVLAIKYKDGIMMAADNLGSLLPSAVMLCALNISPI